MTAPRTHHLKTWPEYFEQVLSGRKPFEHRLNDRDFQVGDELVLQEFDPRTRTLTGREITRRVTCVLPGDDRFGITRDFVCMGMAPIAERLYPEAGTLTAARLGAWHRHQFDQAALRAENWRAAAHGLTGLSGARFAVAKASADAEAEFHLAAARLLSPARRRR